jgi:hypothetical protein
VAGQPLSRHAPVGTEDSMSGQFVNEQELNSIKGLLHYLNNNFTPDGGQVSADVNVIDSNGESVGRIEWVQGIGYALHFPS